MHAANVGSAVRGRHEKASAVDGDADHSALDALVARQEAEIESLCMEILARYEEATLVYRLSDQIGSVVGESGIAGLVVREAAAILGSGTAELWLQQGSGLVRAAVFPDRQEAEPGAAVRATIATGRTHVRDAVPGEDATAVVALPGGGDSILGALALTGRVGDRAYLSGDVKLMSAVAALAAAFIRNERLAEKARGDEVRRRESEIAREIHRGLLPRDDPSFAGLDLSGGFVAADGLGGDYYGYVAMADGSLGLAIADLSGHGVAAALYMAIAKGALESEARVALRAGDILGRLNEVLVHEFRSADMFATAAFARFLPRARRLGFSNAGHNPPLLLRASGATELLKPTGPALGIVSGPRWLDEETSFVPGDVLLFYTDGIVEARDRDHRLFGVSRLIDAARKPAPCAAAIRENVLAAIADHVDGAPAIDDFTLVVARAVPIEDEP